MKEKLNVKDKSVLTFLEERLLNNNANEKQNRCGSFDSSPYYLMKDEMLFKIDCGIKVGQSVEIELFDRTNGSNKELKNIYTYIVEYYDDVAIKLRLINFEILKK